MGQKNKRTRRRARRGTRPHAPHDQRTEGAYLFGALCPAKAKGDGRVMPCCDTHAMVEPLKLIGQQVEAGAHALLILDRAGGQSSPKGAVPDTITLVPRPPRSPEVNPVENVWPFIRDTWLSTLVFKTCDDIADHCCQAWNTLRHQPGRAISIGGRECANFVKKLFLLCVLIAASILVLLEGFDGDVRTEESSTSCAVL